MRKLWEDHVTWTRLYIVSALAELPDLGAVQVGMLQALADHRSGRPIRSAL